MTFYKTLEVIKLINDEEQLLNLFPRFQTQKAESIMA